MCLCKGHEPNWGEKSANVALTPSGGERLEDSREWSRLRGHPSIKKPLVAYPNGLRKTSQESCSSHRSSGFEVMEPYLMIFFFFFYLFSRLLWVKSVARQTFFASTFSYLKEAVSSATICWSSPSAGVTSSQMCMLPLVKLWAPASRPIRDPLHLAHAAAPRSFMRVETKCWSDHYAFPLCLSDNDGLGAELPTPVPVLH